MKVIDHHTCLNIIMKKINKVKLFINNNLKSRKAAEEIKNELLQCSKEVKRLDDKMYVLNEIVQKYK